MRTNRRQLGAFFLLLSILATSACSASPRKPDLGRLYNVLARNEDPYRNPVILIPGILGSKPESLHLYLVAGDAEDTDIMKVAYSNPGVRTGCSERQDIHKNRSGGRRHAGKNWLPGFHSLERKHLIINDRIPYV